MLMFSILLFFISGFIIFWTMIGYPIFLKLLENLYKNRKLNKNYQYTPTVTVLVVAHNEEEVIYKKLTNLIQVDYPKKLLKIIVSSDNSTDNTNELVRLFKRNNPGENIILYEVKERRGKTNAQNEAQKLVDSEILVMTDANAMFKKDAIRELVSSFVDKDISYVCGRLVYINYSDNKVAANENTYWEKEMRVREIESNIQTITAGNGAIYACRNSEYFNFKPIQSHDSNMPRYYALKGNRALFNPDAIAYEKAGEIIEDEFKRKVRMNRSILKAILPNISILNIFKYKWYTVFFISHRSFRNLLWLAHLIFFISNIPLALYLDIFKIPLVLQMIFYLLAFIKQLTGINHKYINLIHYYCMTISAQWVGVYNMLTGQSKPYWDKAESTRK